MTAHAYQHRKLNSQTVTTELICMLTTLANGEGTAKYQEVDADKEFERALIDRLEGNDM